MPREGLGEALHAPSSPCTEQNLGKRRASGGKSFLIPLGKKHEGKINPDPVRKEARGGGGKASHSSGRSAAQGGPGGVSCEGLLCSVPWFQSCRCSLLLFGILSALESWAGELSALDCSKAGLVLLLPEGFSSGKGFSLPSLLEQCWIWP